MTAFYNFQNSLYDNQLLAQLLLAQLLLVSHFSPSQNASIRVALRPLSLRPLPMLSAVALGGCALGFALANVWDAQFVRVLPSWFLFSGLIFLHVAAFWAARFRLRTLPILWLATGVFWALCAVWRTLPDARDIAQSVIAQSDFTQSDFTQSVRNAPNSSLPQSPRAVQLRGTVADEPRIGEFGLEFPFDVDRVLDVPRKPKRAARDKPNATPDSQSQSPLSASAPTDSAPIASAPTDFTANWRETQGRVWLRLPLPSFSLNAESLNADFDEKSAASNARFRTNSNAKGQNELAPLEEGDALWLRAELSDLPRAGNLGERESRARFLTARCWAVAKVRKNADWKRERRVAVSSLSHRLTLWRRAIAARYDASFAALNRPFPFASSQLLVAMVFGEGGLSQPLPRLTRDRFRAAGMSHLLVASGTQVAFLALALLGIARWMGLRRTGLLLLVLPVLLLYALLTGGASSIWRATLAGACVAWALLLGRDVDGISLWSLAIVILLGLDPLQLHDLGFQLTFGATWGLLVLAPPLRRVLQRAWGQSRVLDAAALTVSAQIATTPLLLYHFGRLSFAALGANFLAIPLAGLLVGSGILGLVLPLGAFNYHVIRIVDNLATFAASLPGAQSDAPPLRLGWTIFAYFLILAALLSTQFPTSTNRNAWICALPARLLDKMRGVRTQGFVALLALMISVALLWRAVAPRPLLRVTMLDVGQGESLLIQAPSGRNVLIDGGTSGDEGRGEVGRAVIVPFLQAAKIDKIDVMVLTHADADHCNALPQVVREVPVAMALDGAAFYANASQTNAASANATSASMQSSTRTTAFVPEYEAIKSAWRDKKVPVFAAQSGQKIDLGDGAVLTVLAPSRPALEGDNDNGAVLRLDYGATSFLFTADIEAAAEERLVRRGANLRATVLKVGHHGSKTSSTAMFLRAVNPSLALVSCGRYNRFGHPAPATMAHLQEQKTPTFRTDVSGAIEVACDGKSCDVQTFR